MSEPTVDARTRVPYIVTPIPGRENPQSKGRRYLLEGRLEVTHVDVDRIRATCRGQDDTHRLGYGEGHWWCSCPARGLCAHLVALKLVTRADR